MLIMEAFQNNDLIKFKQLSVCADLDNTQLWPHSGQGQVLIAWKDYGQKSSLA